MAPSDSARAWVRQAVETMGGADRLRSLRSMRLQGMGHEYWIGIAERPTGPWPVMYHQFSELRDLQHLRIRRTVSTRWEQLPTWQTTVFVMDDSAASTVRGTRSTPAQPSRAAAVAEELMMAPERVLLSALEAPDLRAEPDTMLQGTPHRRVSFTRDGIPVELSLNAHTMLPTSVAVQRAYPDDFQRHAFGQATTRSILGSWKLLPNGLLYPHKYNIYFNETEWRDYTLFRIELDVPAPADSFQIHPEIRAAYHQSQAKPPHTRRPGDGGPPTEVREGIVSIRDFWHSTIVRQDDGLVIFEAHVSPEYARALMEEAQRRFPGLPIKALVLTSDPWTHLGGIRAYAERDIPIYVLDASAEFVRRLVSGPSKPILRPVSSKTMLGTGPNRIELYPIRGEYGERMLMAYFPEHRLLYGTDLLWRKPTGDGYVPTQAWELARAVAREGLDVDSVFHVHAATPAAWTDVLQSIPTERREFRE